MSTTKRYQTDDVLQLEGFSLFDYEKSIEQLENDRLLRDLLKLMVNYELPSDEEALQQAFNAKDWCKVKNIAHKIKSGALYCGTVRLQYACQYIEQENDSNARLETLYQQLLAVMYETKLFVSEWLKIG